MQQRGQHRTSNELRKQRVFISGSGVRSVWFRHNLENFKKRLKALERRASDDEACGEIETAHPGYLGSQDIFYVGNLKGVGRIYQQTFSARLCVLFFLTIGCQKMMAAARLTMSVLLLNIPSGGVMMLVRSAARWPLVCATLCPAPDRYRSRVISPLIIPFLSKITLSVV